MRKDSYVLVLVLLIAGVCVCLGVFRGSVNDAAGWNPTALYNDPISSWGGSSYTNATLSGGSSANSGWSMPMSGSGFSLRARRATAPVYYASSPNSLSSPVAGTSEVSPLVYRGSTRRGRGFNSLLASSPNMTLHATSSAEYRSFGGGGNGGYTSSSISSPVAGSPNNLSIFGVPYRGGAQRAEGFNMPNSLIAQSPNSLITSSPNTPIAAVYANTGAHGYSVYGSSALSNPVAAYSSACTSGASPISYAGRVAGKHNAPPTNSGGNATDEDGNSSNDQWLNWMDNWYGSTEEGFTKWGTQNEDGVWLFDFWDALEAYEAWCKSVKPDWSGEESDSSLPTFDEWLAWFQIGVTHTGANGSYQYIPVGDIMPLLLIALLYLAAMLIKSVKLLATSKTLLER